MRVRSLLTLLALVAVLAGAGPVSAANISNTKIIRVRTSTTNGFVFIEPQTRPTRTCDGGGFTDEAETYIFDPDTPAGRVLYAQVLAAYSTAKTVDITGAGTCVNFGAGFTATSFENISNLTIR